MHIFLIAGFFCGATLFISGTGFSWCSGQNAPLLCFNQKMLGTMAFVNWYTSMSAARWSWLCRVWVLFLVTNQFGCCFRRSILLHSWNGFALDNHILESCCCCWNYSLVLVPQDSHFKTTAGRNFCAHRIFLHGKVNVVQGALSAVV